MTIDHAPTYTAPASSDETQEPQYIAVAEEAVKAFFDNAAAIIGAAAKSPLGIVALMVLVLACLGIAFFRNASEKTRIAVYVLLVIGFAGFAAAVMVQSGASGATRTEAGPLIIRGVITDHLSRQVLSGVTVLVAATPFEATSDANGRFEGMLPNAPARTRLEITAHREGYFAWRLERIVEDPHGTMELDVQMERAP
jgi:hypothetical protein